jgi:hypothetical protein
MKKIFWKIIELSTGSIIFIYKLLFKPIFYSKKEWKWILSKAELETMYKSFYISGKIDFNLTYEDFIEALRKSNSNPRFKEYGKSYIIPNSKSFFAHLDSLNGKNVNKN